MTAPECRYLAGMGDLAPRGKRMTCIQSLAEGWINPPDLCPACTQAFMTALDGIDGPMVWHHNYLERVKADGTDATDV